MATLIEKLWRCKSANGARQNNCPPTGPQLNTKKRGNLDLKERLREPEKKRSARKTSLLLGSRRWFSLSLFRDGGSEKKEVGGGKVAPLNELFSSKSASFLGKFGASSPLPGTWSGSLGSGTIAPRPVGRRSTVQLSPQTWTRSRPPLIPSPQQPQV